MKLLEWNLVSKTNNPVECEDGIFISPNFICIIDGVTSKGNIEWNGKKSGNYAKDIILKSLKSCKKDVNCEDLLNFLSCQLQKEMDKKFKEVIPKEERLRACVIIYSNYFKEIWNYGDCQCIINGQLFSHSKKIDQIIAEKRFNYIIEYLMNGVSEEDLLKNDLSRIKIQPLLIQQFDFENVNSVFGYPVLNGKKINERLIIKQKVKRNDKVVLASDGYPNLKATLQESEKELNNLIINDPLCYKVNKGTKGILPFNNSFDDRAFCSFIVE